MILPMRNSSNTQGLLDLIADLPHGIEMLEIGCYSGESTEMFLKSDKVLKLHAVDLWDDPLGVFRSMNGNHSFAEVETLFDARTQGYPVIKYKMSVQQAFPELPLVDFVYIDANHDYEYVLNDIKTSLKLVKPGGLIGGHDYISDTPGVVRAVDEMFGSNFKLYSDASWVVKC